MQDAFGICKPGPGVKQWTPAYIIGSALAGVTIFCTSFGEFIWKGSLTWVRLSHILAASSHVCTASMTRKRLRSCP